MARRRISDIWGGTSKDWSDSITPSVVRRVLAILLALPLSAIGFAVADNPNTPAAARLFIAPGYVIAMHLPIYTYAARLLDNLGRFGMTALSINLCYYTLLLLGLMRAWRAAKGSLGDS